jgi:hypothetical protein
VPDELDDEPLEPDPDEPLSLDVPSFFEPPSLELLSLFVVDSPPDFLGELP